MAKGSCLRFDDDGREVVYSYATTSVDRIPELQASVDDLDRAGKLSGHEVFREYIRDARYAVPEGFENPRSLVALAVETRLMRVAVLWDGRARDAFVPPQYYRTGLSPETLRRIVEERIVATDGHRAERLVHGHMKFLAVRTGLGRYGRNNLCYVNGMGTLVTLYAFVTDSDFEEDEWTDVGMMAACSDCRICRDGCPTHAIPQEGFVLDVGKCLTLYNEIDGDFPEWIPPGVHHAMVGCMRCQLPCPENREPLTRAGRLPDLTQAEVGAILSDPPERAALESAAEKLRIGLSDGGVRAVIARNLRALLEARPS